jgi:hypothetical protein
MKTFPWHIVEAWLSRLYIKYRLAIPAQNASSRTIISGFTGFFIYPLGILNTNTSNQGTL